MAEERQLKIRQTLVFTFVTEVLDGEQATPVPFLSTSVVLTDDEVAQLPLDVLRRARQLLTIAQRVTYYEAAELLRTQYEAMGGPYD